MDLNEESNAIRSRDDFVHFVKALLRDFEENPSGWENHDLGSFLDAVAAWTEDMDGYFENRGEPTPQQPDWRLLGQIMLAAKYYE